MLLSNKMASIPCSPRHSISNIQDLPNLFSNHFISVASPPATPSLQYFNMRVTQRLHRYRTLKRQWQEVATAVQHDPLSTPKSESPVPIPDILPMIQEQIIERKVNDMTLIKENHGKNSIQLDPLRSRIQRDLIKLRKLIKAREKNLSEPVSSKTSINHKPSGESTSINISYEDQDNNNTINFRKLSSLNRNKPLEQVKISGCQMRPATFPQTDTPENRNIIPKSNSSSTCSQYSKLKQKVQQQNTTKTFNIYRSRVNPSLPSDSLLHGVPPPKKNLNTSPKTTTTTTPKQTQSYRLPVPPIIKKKQLSFVKQETILPLIRQPSVNEPPATCLYTYAASTSSATPRFMKLSRNTSLLPIILTSSSCMGIPPQKSPSEENNDDLHDYEQLVNDLPSPLISIHPQYGQDDYGMLFEQLDHIRETMPDSNVYDKYTRIY